MIIYEMQMLLTQYHFNIYYYQLIHNLNFIKIILFIMNINKMITINNQNLI